MRISLKNIFKIKKGLKKINSLEKVYFNFESSNFKVKNVQRDKKNLIQFLILINLFASEDISNIVTISNPVLTLKQLVTKNKVIKEINLL